MGDPVFANLMQISSKSMSGKSICEAPDVCFTPPQTPATPTGVPIPYPNTAQASATDDGSKSVQIGGEEVMLKDTSSLKQTAGDEAGSAPNKGLMTSSTKGAAYFIAWSMDVKFEGENVVRHLDMTTHNHGSKNATGLAPTVHVASQAVVSTNKCTGNKKKAKDACNGKEKCPGALSQTVTEQRGGFTKGAGGLSRTAQAGAAATKDAEGSPCVKAMRCALRPYSASSEDGGCCPGQTPHHIPPKSMMSGVKDYSMGSALCVCLEGASQHVGSHGQNHAALDYLAGKEGYGSCTVSQYNEVCAQAVAAQCGCNKDCIKQQLDESFTDKQKSSKVTHYQSNSKQLGKLSGKLDKIHAEAAATGAGF